MKIGKVNWLCSLRRSVFAIALAMLTQLAYAESDYAAAWGPSIGSSAPMLSAVDQNDNHQDFESLKGSNGLLFVFNRSVDW